MNPMAFARLLLLAFLFLVCSRTGVADQDLKLPDKKTFDCLKQLMDSNVAALRSGCVVDFKWLFSPRHGPHGKDIAYNSERSARVAIKGDLLLTKTWYTGRFDTAAHAMVPVNEQEVQAAFAGQKYIQTNGGEYLISDSPENVRAVYDVFQAYPLTAMFAFLVPRQGHVPFSDVASSSNWNAFVTSITHAGYDGSGNLVVSTQRSDGVGEEITFSAANGFYPSKIRMSWNNNEFVTQVVDWVKTDVFGTTVQFVPKTITGELTKKGEADPVPNSNWKISLDPQSLTKLPDNTPRYFNLPVASGSLMHDMDVNVDVRVP